MMNETRKVQLGRNILIVAGFYGIYFALIQLIALVWRQVFVLGKTFTGEPGQVLSWFLWEFPYWTSCLASGFLLPFVILSERRKLWAAILGCVFSAHILLFTAMHYVRQPTGLEITLDHLKWILPLPLCMAGTLIHQKVMKR